MDHRSDRDDGRICQRQPAPLLEAGPWTLADSVHGVDDFGHTVLDFSRWQPGRYAGLYAEAASGAAHAGGAHHQPGAGRVVLPDDGFYRRVAAIDLPEVRWVCR